MTFNKRKKNSRQKASHTYGWGSMKKHRGAGNRGGSGMSGTGKRADSMKPSIWGDAKFFGRHGFHTHNPTVNAINISLLEEQLSQLIEKKLATKDKEIITINLRDLGIQKLLGRKSAGKLAITAMYASKSAREAIKAAGGTLTLTAKPKAVKQPIKPKKAK